MNNNSNFWSNVSQRASTPVSFGNQSRDITGWIIESGVAKFISASNTKTDESGNERIRANVNGNRYISLNFINADNEFISLPLYYNVVGGENPWTDEDSDRFTSCANRLMHCLVALGLDDTYVLDQLPQVVDDSGKLVVANLDAIGKVFTDAYNQAKGKQIMLDIAPKDGVEDISVDAEECPTEITGIQAVSKETTSTPVVESSAHNVAPLVEDALNNGGTDPLTTEY